MAEKRIKDVGRKAIGKRIWKEILVLFLAGVFGSSIPRNTNQTPTNAMVTAIFEVIADLVVVVTFILLIIDIIKYYKMPKDEGFH